MPFLNFQSSMGLKKNFTAELCLSTLLVSNQLSAGFRLHTRISQKFAFNLGFDIATVIGEIRQLGFNSRVGAVEQQGFGDFLYRRPALFIIPASPDRAVCVWYGSEVSVD